MKLTLEQCAQWCGGRLVGDPSLTFSGVVADSRLVNQGDLFVGISGPKFNGNEYVAAAIAHGAVAGLVENEAALGSVPGVVVENSIVALGELARHYRQSLDIPWIGITGSNGKTTTRELLAEALSVRGPVACSTRNYNNAIGVPLSILNAPDGAWAGVIELGSSAAGEISQLAEILKPTIAVITSAGRAHIGCFDSEEGIAREKASIFAALPEEGLAVFPAHSSCAHLLRETVGCRCITFGIGGGADIWADQVVCEEDGISFQAWNTVFQVPLIGIHNVGNVMATVAVADSLGINPAETAESLKSFSPVAGRLSVHHFGKVTVIDDSYNANPDSVNAAVTTLCSMRAQRRVVIVGAMLELGDSTEKLHRECGHLMACAGVDVVIAIGKETISIAEAAATSSASIKVHYFPKMSAAFPKLSKLIQEGDLVLIKGSRGAQMERVVGRLEKLYHHNAFVDTREGEHA